MPTKASTTIYIEPEQKKKIKTIAKRDGVSFSDTVRSAINDFLLQKQETTVSPDELVILSKEASDAIDRIVVKINKAHEAVTAAFKEMEKIR